MNLNLHIIGDEMKLNCYNVSATEDTELDLKGFALFLPEANLSEDTLYIVSSEQAEKAVSRLFNVKLLICGKTECEHTLLENGCRFLSTALKPEEAVNFIQKIFTKYNEWENSVIKTCCKGTFDSVCDAISKILINPFFIIDNASNILQVAGKIPDPPNGLWKYVFSGSQYDLSQNLANDKIFPAGKYFATSAPYWVKSDECNTPFINVEICPEGKKIGDLTLTETNAPLSYGQFSMLKYIAKIIEWYFRTNGMFSSSKDTLKLLVFSILAKESVDNNLLKRQLSLRRWKIEDKYYIAKIIPKDSFNASEEFLNCGFSSIQNIFLSALIFNHSDYLIAVFRSADEEYPFRAKQEEFQKLLLRMELVCGVSRPFFSFKDLSIYEQQAHMTLSANRKSDRALFFFDKYYYECIKSMADSCIGDFRVLCLPEVLKIEKYDKEYNTELLKSLYVYMSKEMKRKEAAEELHIHPNTMAYRLKKISDICGKDFIRQEDSTMISLSCNLLLHKK